MHRILVIIPTYNESENIAKIIKEVTGKTNNEFEYNVLVVDDNSPDGTAEIVENLNNSRVFILRREKKMGLGTAYIAGFKYAIKNNYNYVFEMDADFSHDPGYLPEFMKKIKEGYDLVVGSRYINGISVVNWPIQRLFLSYFANIYTRIVTGLKVHDTTAGFMCYDVKKLSTINLDNIRSNGYSFQIEMKFKYAQKKYRIAEIPILFIDRRAGSSKMSRKVVYEAFYMVWKIKIKSFFIKD
jgi:dolichol-phosphate mannosyltransferase